MKRIGLTTTVPVEVIFASGNVPVDLNNIFITNPNSAELIERAEQRGFPRNICAWIKGMYTAASLAKVDLVVGVSEGDCSNTGSLLEVWRDDGVEVIEFRYPRDRDRQALEQEIEKFANLLGATPQVIEEVRNDLKRIRQKLAYLDQLTAEGRATGFENHLWQVSASDFNGDYRKFEIDLDQKLVEIEGRTAESVQVKIGYIGVPPIIGDIYSQIEELGGRVVFNEVQRQFTLASGVELPIVDSYLRYTYPYPLEQRLGDIQQEIDKRGLDGIVHYTQAFCHRAIEDMVVRKKLNIPVLKLEGDQPGILDSRSKLRLEAFVDMLKDLRRESR